MKNLKVTGSRCLCQSCGDFFNSTGAFEKHRVGKYTDHSRRCLDATEMRAAGMSENAMGYWTASRDPRYQETADITADGKITGAEFKRCGP